MSDVAKKGETNALTNPKVFFSYAWTSQEYITQILDIAERLMADGIDVVIDQWDLGAGKDKYAFMEKAVSDPTINHVLMMLNKEYKEKADNREGGAGTEAQIISAELYNKTDQIKFIPVVMERDEEGKEYAPVFLNGRIYIDLSFQDKFEENYDQLIRAITHRPQFRKPKLGTLPTYLFDEKENDADLRSCEKRLMLSIEKNDPKAMANVSDYLKVFREKLETCQIDPQSYAADSNIGRACYEKYLDMRVYRNSFLAVIKAIAVDKNKIFTSFYDFFLDVERYYKPLNSNRRSWYESEFDNFRLFVFELILYTFAILIKYDRFDFLKYSISHSFIRESEGSFFYIEPLERRVETIFDKFQWPNAIGDYYKSIKGEEYYSSTGEIIKNNIYPELSFFDLVEVDMFLCYYCLVNMPDKLYFPELGVYAGQSSLFLFKKLLYKNEIATFLSLFGVTDKEEFYKKINACYLINKNFLSYYRGRIPNITDIVKYELWGTLA